jgi:dihydroorotase
MSSLLLRGGRLLDPSTGFDDVCDVLVVDGVIGALGGEALTAAAALTDVETLDVTDCWVTPGLVDLHTHLREPGGEGSEDIATGSQAAVVGGYTAVSPMANTDPVADTAVVVELVARRGREVGLVDVLPVGSITRGLEGRELTPFGELRSSLAAVDFFSDDGIPLGDSLVMRRALQYSLAFDVVVCNHAQDPALTADAQMNEGAMSAVLGLPGWPREAEEIMLARDVILAHGVGARLHVPHLTTAGGVEIVRAAKRIGARISAEVTPHHLVLDDAEVVDFDPVMKVNPPLRTVRDIEALRAALADGTIDAVATDHAPHGQEHKRQPWEHAPCGMLGLETAFPLIHTELVLSGQLTPLVAVARFTTGPAAVRNTRGHGGPIVVGAPANLQVFDPTVRWRVDRDELRSRSRNTPFHGRELIGRARHTILRGRLTLRDGRPGTPGDPPADHALLPGPTDRPESHDG